jgi:hypothetical protein
MWQVSRSGRHTRRLLLGAAILAAAPAAGMAAGADNRWQEAAGGAVAILPAPSNARAIVGGSLSCAEQRWSFVLRTEPGSVAPGTAASLKLVVGDSIFEANALEVSGTVQFAVDRAILDPLRNGARLGVSMGEKGSIAKAVFPLSGSRAVIDAIKPRCSPVDMAGYEQVTLSQADPGVEAAVKMMKDEAKLFTAFTGKKPVFSATTLDLRDDRHLLFASLCGSTAYYGPSGCTLSGFARTAVAGPWQEVYNTEGLALYTDPAATRDGWPGLVTLPQDGDAKTLWTWNGNAYSPREGEARTAQDDVVRQ